MITDIEYKNLNKQQRDNIRDEANNRMADYLATRYGITNLNKNFRCPVCGHDNDAHYYEVMKGTGKPGIFCYSGKGCKNKGYDVIDLVGIDHGLTDYNDKLLAAANELGISIPAAGTVSGVSQASPAAVKPAADQQQQKKYDPEGISRFIRQAAGEIQNSKAAAYMMGRGFDLSFLQEMRIGYDSYHNAVVIPYSKNPDPNFEYYVMRYIDPKTDAAGKLHRFYKPYGVTEPIFHADNLSNGMPYVFICEAQIDALSIEQAGGNAVALGSVNNGSKLLDSVKQLQAADQTYRNKKNFIISFDHDTAGIAAEKELIKALADEGFIALSANDAGLYDHTPDTMGITVKDINDMLRYDPATLTARIERMISSPADVYRDSYSVGSFRNEYQRQRETNSSCPRISTGFTKLDEVLGGGIRPGLFFLGAITSIGKSTLVMQIADHIAKQGRDVLIFALEMSRFELVSRSISRESYRIAKGSQTPQPGNALTFYEISDGQPLTAAKTNVLKQAEDYYFKAIAPHIFIVEGEGQVTAEAIRQQVQTHTELTGAAPVVIVDYLQLLQPPKYSFRLSDKQIVDINTMAMKHISRDYVTPVIAVMSLNRAAYNEDVNLASGKESGAIEYGCDVLLGMNQEKENEDGTRSIYIDILKNRNSTKDRRVTFTYTPAYSSFKDNAAMRIPKKKDQGKKHDTDHIKKGERDNNGYLRL